jgi:hypothetical protein
MRIGIGIWLTAVVVLAVAAKSEAQQVRGEVSLTTERQGVSLNSDVRFYQSRHQFFALARIFINEPDASEKQPTESTGSLGIEAAAGRYFRRGATAVGPLAGIDSNKRILAGATFLTNPRGHSIVYTGYVRVATDSQHTNGTRHRLIFDLRKNEKLFLRLDWKTEGSRHEHSRLGLEFDARIDRLNLPVYLEPFWDFAAKRIGIRVGIKL